MDQAVKARGIAVQADFHLAVGLAQQGGQFFALNLQPQVKLGGVEGGFQLLISTSTSGSWRILGATHRS